jgi:hypothetical protein
MRYGLQDRVAYSVIQVTSNLILDACIRYMLLDTCSCDMIQIL